MLKYWRVHCAFSPISALPAIRRRLFQQTARSGIRLLPLFALLLSACAGTGGGSVDTTASSATVSDDDLQRAIKLMQESRYQPAAAELEKIVDTNDRYTGAYVNLGIAYRELGRREDAEKALLLATERKSHRAMAWNELGLLYRRHGDFARARKAYEQGIAADSGYARPYVNLGVLCDIYLQDKPCALRSYEKYQALTKGEDKKVDLWIADLRNRMGIARGATK
jgi:Flp pilus assembly protein TadD